MSERREDGLSDPNILYSCVPVFLSVAQTAKRVKAAHVCRGCGMGCG